MTDDDAAAATLDGTLARLEVDYLAPTPLGVELLVRGEIEQVAARKVIVDLTVHSGSVHEPAVARGRVIAVLMPQTMGA